MPRVFSILTGDFIVVPNKIGLPGKFRPRTQRIGLPGESSDAAVRKATRQRLSADIQLEREVKPRMESIDSSARQNPPHREPPTYEMTVTARDMNGRVQNILLSPAKDKR